MAPNLESKTILCPNKYLPIPKCINEEYFREIVEKDVLEFSHILNFNVMAATAPGENFTSVMIRVVMDIELKDHKTENISYIVKTCLEDGDGAEFVKTINLFPKEKKMYQVYLPEFEQLYKQTDLNVKFSARCIHVDETPERITIILEDLSRKHFKNVDRIKGLDFLHAECVLQKLAELHAASAIYYELNGPFDEIYSISFYKESNRSMLESFLDGRQETIFRAMREWGLENVEWYIENSDSAKGYFDKVISLNDVDPNEFNVLNHGDCWTNNIMFNYKENGDIDNTIFVDYQVAKWGTPAQDLWFFIINSISWDIKIKEFDTFISIYHTRLEECLKKLKYPKKVPTLKDLHIMLLKYSYWAIFAATSILPAAVFPSDKDASMDLLIKVGPDSNDFQYKLFSNPAFVRCCLQIYPFLKNKGIWKI